MRCSLFALPFLLALPVAAQTSSWQLEPSETTADLRGIHAVGGGVVWASGTRGTVLRSEDSGFEWQNCSVPPGADALDFRAVWAWDGDTALALSSGPGEQSRLYRTTDGCEHWTEITRNHNPNGFWDGIVFSDRKNGFLVGDPVDGQLYLAQTQDGGLHWTRIAAKSLDTQGRALFAASNSSIALAGAVLGTPQGAIHTPWIGLSGPGGAQVLSGGLSCGMETAHHDPTACFRFWDFQPMPVPLAGGSDTAGVFSLHMQGDTPDNTRAIAVGGDYSRFNDRTGTAAWWSPAKGWQPAATLPNGYRSAVDCDPHRCIAVGPNGSDLSLDGGQHWAPLEHAPADAPKGGEWNALSLPWAVGPHGRIGKLNPDALPKTLAPKPR